VRDQRRRERGDCLRREHVDLSRGRSCLHPYGIAVGRVHHPLRRLLHRHGTDRCPVFRSKGFSLAETRRRRTRRSGAYRRGGSNRAIADDLPGREGAPRSPCFQKGNAFQQRPARARRNGAACCSCGFRAQARERRLATAGLGPQPQ
jgi:hypothetical protein